MCSFRYFSSEMRSEYLVLRQFKNLLHILFFRYFNFWHALWKNTSQPKIDRLGGYWGSCIMMRVLQTLKTKKLVARKCYKDLQLLLIPVSGWKNLLIRKTRVTTWVWLPISTDLKDTSQDLGRVFYVYQLTSHDLCGNKLWFDPFHCEFIQ